VLRDYGVPLLDAVAVGLRRRGAGGGRREQERRETRREGTPHGLASALLLAAPAARAAPPQPDGYRLEDFRSPTPAALTVVTVSAPVSAAGVGLRKSSRR
jgi:hypothetical protein